jgi:glycosyltransferase involved in cell wall biosynthesis
VIVPTHNRLEKLQAALASIDNQTFRDFELIVVDDGSLDGSAEWIKGAGRTLLEIPPPGAGAAAARNLALQVATGEIIAFLDDDDRWLPEYLAKQVARFDSCPNADVTVMGHTEVNASGAVTKPLLEPAFPYPTALARLLAECPIHTLSVAAFRRAAFDRVGLFDESLRIVHDLDWYIRAMQAGGEFVFTPERLVEHAVPGGLVTKHRDWFHEEQAVQRRCIGMDKRERDAVDIARNLFFARTALAGGDVPFALARAATGFAKGPRVAVSMIAQRLRQRRRSSKMEEAQ